MTWLHRRLIDLFDRFARWYYRRKYGSMAGRLGREDVPPGRERGFIVIQIDGLAHEYLLEAMGRGVVPTLERLLAAGGMKLSRWRCGLPSSTPAVQAGVMYGNNWDIPSFRWQEKDRGRSVVCKIPSLVRDIQDRVSEGRQGILSGGSSYVNMFDGGARLSLFTLSAWGRDRLFENVRGAGFLLLFALSPIRAFRTLGVSVGEYARGLWIRFVSQFGPGPRRRFALFRPFLQTMVTVVFREIETFAVMVDIYRGVPNIWANYFGYDEVAHHVGSLGSDALRELKELDRQVRQIDRMRRQSPRREYDLIVLSDHGQSPSRPFRELHGITLGAYIADQLGEPVSLDETFGQVYHGRKPAEFLLQELKGLEEGRSVRQLALLHALQRRLDDKVPADPEVGYNLERRSDVAVRSSGSLAHVYFNLTADAMDLGEVAILYPDLLTDLLAQESIGLILGRHEGRPAIVAPSGVLPLSVEDADDEDHPLSTLREPRRAAEQLRRLASFPHSGDLILLGAWSDDGSVVCFEDQWASHGGLGGPQGYPFILHPTHNGWNIDAINNAEQLHRCFLDTYEQTPDAALS